MHNNGSNTKGHGCRLIRKQHLFFKLSIPFVTSLQDKKKSVERAIAV